MGANSTIEWCDHTFNPWIGCTRVSPGCDNCYAERLATNRLGVPWGPHAERRRTAASTWQQPLAWNRQAQREGRRARVFCASLADVFDNQVPGQWRSDLWLLIRNTPHLDWLLLTKRPQNIAKMLPCPEDNCLPEWGTGWPNVWLGTTAENQAEADRRTPHLLAIPARVRFLSCEPLLGPVDLRFVSGPNGTQVIDALRGASRYPHWVSEASRIHWVISGGESGPGARPSAPNWHRNLRDQCADAGAAYFFKQWGEWQRLPSPEGGTHYLPGGMMKRVGKKSAGRTLDGREHTAFPT